MTSLSNFDIKLYDEVKRIKTFKNWPHSSGNITKEKMAENGFYHCGDDDDDITQCIFCQIRISDWKIDDDPMVEHLKANPDCLFANIKKSQNDITYEELSTIISKKNEMKILQYFENIKKKEIDKIEKVENFLKKIK